MIRVITRIRGVRGIRAIWVIRGSRVLRVMRSGVVRVIRVIRVMRVRRASRVTFGRVDASQIHTPNHGRRGGHNISQLFFSLLLGRIPKNLGPAEQRVLLAVMGVVSEFGLNYY